MNKDEIEEFAIENNLDLRVIEFYHLRLINSLGKYILDVFIKRNKNGNIVRNTTFCFKTKKWSVSYNTNDLQKLI